MTGRNTFLFISLLFISSIGIAQETVLKSRFSAILVKEKNVADSLVLELHAGADFSQLAKQFSIGPNENEGGDLGYFASGDMAPALNAAVLDLAVGEYTEPIMQNSGYFILKKTEEREFALPASSFFSPTVIAVLFGLTPLLALLLVWLNNSSVLPNHSPKNQGEVEEVENFSAALLAGMISAFLGAIIWATVTVATEYQIGYMAIGVRFLVGFSVQHWGHGRTLPFGLVGGFFALLGCFLGNYLSICYFVSQESYMSFFEFLMSDTSSEILAIVLKWTDAMTVLFYFLAASAGYSLAIRGAEEESESASG